MARATDPVVATYSIAACDLYAGQWGVATQSKFLAVGSVVPWAEAGAGAVATPAYANPRYGPDGLALLRSGASAQDPGRRLAARARRTGSSGGRRPRTAARSGSSGSSTPAAGRRPSPGTAASTGPAVAPAT